MPTYCFSNDRGQYAEMQFPMGKAPRTIHQDGNALYRDIAAEQGGQRSGTQGWPLHCEASAIHPSQVKEMEQWNANHGVDVRYDPAGRPVFESRQQRAKCLGAWGYHDRDAGYTDPC